MSTEAVPAFRADKKCIDTCRSVLAVVGAVLAVAAILVGALCISMCCQLGMLAGAFSIVLGAAVMSWSLMMSIRLLGIGKAQSLVSESHSSAAPVNQGTSEGEGTRVATVSSSAAESGASPVKATGEGAVDVSSSTTSGSHDEVDGC
ncbi:hypothetical protein H359_0676 [Chlamydia ibidis 10-1398/6]|nr:hypothetical protein H359_0676 [Chlamydia ibidis 10-1398/6]